MRKTKIALLILAYLLLIIFAIPAVVFALIGIGIIYAVLMIEKMIVQEIDLYSVSHVWRKWIDKCYEVLRDFADRFLMGLELY